MKPLNVLYVEDDTSLAYVTKDNLERKGFKIVHCDNGQDAFLSFQKQVFHFCIIDIMLPKLDGYSLIKQIRKFNTEVPILILSAKSLHEDRIQGFSTGADDYLSKPYSIDELIMKMQVFLKRSDINETVKKQGETIHIGKNIFDQQNMLLITANKTIQLTIRECELLKLLHENVNTLVHRDTIIERVWKNEEKYIGRSIDVFISRLRKHLSDDTDISIESIRKIGYRLVISAEQ